jgi:hypothetical protein
VIPSRRLASVAGDQGVPLHAAAMREWEVQSVTSPTQPTFPVVRKIATPSPHVDEEVQFVEGEAGASKKPARSGKTCECGCDRDVHYYPEQEGLPACSECPSCRKFELAGGIKEVP